MRKTLVVFSRTITKVRKNIWSKKIRVQETPSLTVSDFYTRRIIFGLAGLQKKITDIRLAIDFHGRTTTEPSDSNNNAMESS